MSSQQTAHVVVYPNNVRDGFDCLIQGFFEGLLCHVQRQRARAQCTTVMGLHGHVQYNLLTLRVDRLCQLFRMSGMRQKSISYPAWEPDRCDTLLLVVSHIIDDDGDDRHLIGQQRTGMDRKHQDQ